MTRKSKDRKTTRREQGQEKIKACLINIGGQRQRHDRIINKITIKMKSDLRDNGVKDKFNDNDRATQTGIIGV